MPKSKRTVRETKFSRNIQRWLTKDGIIHRDKGPAYMRHFSGSIEVACWILEGKFGRTDDGPTGIYYPHSYGKPKPTDLGRTEFWLVGPLGKNFDYPANEENRRHRSDGPAVVHYYSGGEVQSQEWWVDGKRHRENGPAVLEFSLEGIVTGEQWFLDGVRAPMATTEYYDNGTLKRSAWIVENIGLHRKDGPALCDHYKNGAPKSVEFFVDGKMTRSTGPAATEYHPNDDPENSESQPYLEQWRVEDHLHRDQGPAVTVWHPNGTIAEVQWWKDGQRRAEGGPAIERWSEHAKPTQQIMWDLPAAELGEIEYLRDCKEPFDWQESSKFPLRYWHRIQLGLDPEPDAPPFTQSEWIFDAALSEVRNRLSYFPNGDAIAERVMRWREPAPRFKAADHDEITRAFVKFIKSHLLDDDEWHALFDHALNEPITKLTSSPKPQADEFSVFDGIFSVTDDIAVPHILNETIYNATGNHFMPIYWITQPLHGVDVTAWANFSYAKLEAVIGPNGIRVGPRDSYSQP